MILAALNAEEGGGSGVDYFIEIKRTDRKEFNKLVRAVLPKTITADINSTNTTIIEELKALRDDPRVVNVQPKRLSTG